MISISQQLQAHSLGKNADKKTRRPLIMAHIVVGYPNLQESLDLVEAMVDEGVAFVELQIPFSDPLADGPTIMEANEVALHNGVSPRVAMQAMEQLASRVSVPLIFMSYVNVLFQYGSGKPGAGVRSFARSAVSAGAQGVIVPDMPPEMDQEEFWDACQDERLAVIPVVSPLTSSRRMTEIANRCRPELVYCVSSMGTTGARNRLDDTLNVYLKRARQALKAPLAVGFGISTAQQVAKLKGSAEIAVVGSATIETMKAAPAGGRIKAVRKFMRELSRPE